MSVAGAKYEWYASEVNGTVVDLTAALNALENQGYEIFDVNGMLIVNQHGWVIIARTAKPAQAEAPPPTEPAKAARGTVALHKGHRR